MAIEAWCQTLAGDILIAGMDKEDNRISQEVLDQIRKDLDAGRFGKGVTALAQIQMLLFFLTIKTAEDYPSSEEESVENISEEELSSVSEEVSEDQE